MKKLFIATLSLVVSAAFAQKDDDIVYYEDSNVRNSRFSAALVLNPHYVDRRLIDDEGIDQSGDFDVVDNDAAGSFALNYNLDLFYSIGSSFDVGVGFGIANAAFEVENAYLYNTPDFDFGLGTDTILINAETEVDMYTVPIKLSFNTSISDLFDLEVIPAVQLIFINNYETTFNAVGLDNYTYDFTEQTQDLNYTVGISLGGTWYFSENWGFFFRGNARYMLNSMIELENYPRETLYGFGANTGVKVRF